MELKIISQILILAITTLLPLVESTYGNYPLALSGCNSTCGDVEVPYPFGMGNSSTPGVGPCFLQLQSNFNLTCENNSTLYWGNFGTYNVPVLDVDILHAQLELSCYVAKFCTNGSFSLTWLRFKDPSFSISNDQNKFLAIGYESYGYVNSHFDGEVYSTGCLTACNGNTKRIINGTCSGIGCCQVDIPPSMKNISIGAYNLSDSFNVSLGEYCSYSFVVKDGYYNFSSTHLDYFPYERVPLILDWSVGDNNCTGSKICGENSYCNDTDIDYGYRCNCMPGYFGNPYHPDGCKDIDECKIPNHNCIDENHCRNIDGSFECFCPEGQSGNGTKEGGGCHQPDIILKVTIGTSAGLITIFVGISLLILIYQKRKLIKLKEKFFEQNGGFILLQQLSTREDSSRNVQIYTEEQLKKATNNFDQSRIIGKGGFGTVFKGFLRDNRTVAIKKSKIIDSSQVNQFINEVVVLSQINHRNVVKLLGCCLETEVPLLVYEFVSNGTLLDFIHSKDNENNILWKTRMRIAAETAGALSYLHSSASIPIIHRDVKSANILLDDSYTAKVSDFGASRLIPLDQTEIATVVQGTIGYLDPEYMQTQQLTEKSDVYSFGVVLAELLTGEKSISLEREEQKRSLAMHFLSCLKEDRIFEILQVGILNDDNREQIKKVAILAAKCMRLRGEERPSMKEVAMELEGIRSMEKHSSNDSELNLMEKHTSNDSKLNLEETQYLLQELSSSIYETGDSSNPTSIGYDSLRDHALIPLEDGR